MAESPLKKILEPESVAFLGASNNINTMGTFQLFNVLEKFDGRVYPVHPTEKEILGRKVFSSISDLPEVVDVVVMVLPTRLVPKILEECGKKGIKHATIVSGGFLETGEDGAELQEKIVEIAEKYGIRFTGPNCIGVCNPVDGYNNTWFSYDYEPGPIGLISQSGTYTCHTFNHINNLGSGFSKAISVGNEASIDLVDCMEYFEQDPHTKCIAMYIEGIRRGREFIRVARRVSRKKPVVALYVGGTEAGARAGASHTAVVAGPDELYEGVFRQAGVLRARNFEELFDWAIALSVQPPMPGDNTVVVTNSGGPGASLSDAAEREGLAVPQLPDDIRDRLGKHIPATGSTRNPVDLTFTMDLAYFMFDLLPNTLLKNDGVHGMLMYGVFAVDRFVESVRKIGNLAPEPMERMNQIGMAMADNFVELIHKYGKPVVGTTFFTRDEDSAIRHLQDAGVPFLPSPDRAASALGALRRRHRILRRLENEPEEFRV